MQLASLDALSTTLTAFGLVGLAEMGDKTQLVCMTLAARYAALPVLLGAVAAFVFLNLLAVMFGAALATWVPEAVVASLVAVLFAVYGVFSLRDAQEDEEEITARTGRSVLLSTAGLIFLAELSDKTQLAVAGLASTAAVVPVWIGATLALSLTSLLGVAAGRTLLRRIPLKLLQRLSGLLFLLLAVIAAWRVVQLLLFQA
jgi:putative Ca2+/H+ antiporter (TMEM165/GDT1 family)